MDRRLQILLDAARYDRVAAEAERSGRSVASVIRQAIDVCYPAGDEERLHVARELLDLSARPRGRDGEGPAELKAALEAELTRKVDAS